jgi:guanine nucleotide-binding protein subunit beta-2-like 1 protein
MTASLATQRLSLEFQAHNDKITKIHVVSEDGALQLYTSSRDGTIKRWTIGADSTGEATARLNLLCKGHGHHVNGFALSPKGNYLVSCSSDKTLRIWSTTEKKKPRILKGHEKEVLCVAIGGQEGNCIFSGGQDGKILMWNTKGEKKRELYSSQKGHKSWVTGIVTTASKNDEFVLSSSEDGTIIRWNVETESIQQKFVGHDQAVVAISMSPDGSLYASAGLDRKIILRDLLDVTQKCEIKVDDQIHSMQFALSAYWLAAGTDNGIIVWDICEKAIIAEIQHEDGDKKKAPCTSLCWEDKFTLFAGYIDGAVRQYTFSMD